MSSNRNLVDNIFKNKPMTKQEALERIEELKKFVEQSDKKKGRFRAEDDEGYWYIDDAGLLGCDYDSRSLGDDRRWEIGNYFETKEQAEKEIARRKVIAKLWDLNEGFEPDWEDSEQKKYHLIRSYYTESWIGTNDTEYQMNLGLPYFASEEALQNAINTLGDELDVLLD